MFCNPCSRRDVESKSTSWCSDCEEGLCSKCLEDHRVIKLTKSHHVVDMTDQISPEHYKLLSIPNCEIHEDLRQDMVCKDHDLICCHQCFQSSHKSCKNVSHLDMAAKGIKQSDWLKNIGHDLKEMTRVSHKIIEERKVSKDGLKNQKKMLSELATVDKDEEEESGKENQELMNMEKEVQADQTALEFVTANGSESQIYSFAQNQSDKQNERVKRLKKIPPNSKVIIELHEASHEIEAIKSLGYLSVNYEKVTYPLIAQGMKRSDDHLSRTEKKDFPNLLLENEVKIEPKDFLEENEVVDDMDLEVHCATVTDDNYIMVAGILRLVVNGNYKTVYQLVKYDEHMNFLQTYRICSFDEFIYCSDSKRLHITAVQQTDIVVICYVKNGCWQMVLIKKAKMNKMLSLYLANLVNNEEVLLTSNSKRIFLYKQHNDEATSDIRLLTFDVLGRRIGISDLDMKFESLIAQPNNTFMGLFNNTVYIVKEDGTEIMSYNPSGLSAVTVDHHGNVFMIMTDGVQVMHPKKDCIHIAFLESIDKYANHKFIGFHSFNKRQTKLLLVTEFRPADNNDRMEYRMFGNTSYNSVRSVVCHIKLLSELQMN
ncbi:unnamed protein product [Mytilus edulis]|uniref:B box-type domain-containing protein n=1 Tax=Mytilus edulis TaxID=6550 RepID=A0A8S3TA65_MYTED|nr:unnamed protein product [Mytilus edulis]